MEFSNPEKGKITVYSKSGCINCIKLKNFLKEKFLAFTIIDCDDYLLDNKEEFLLFLQNKIGYEYKKFPVVFDNGKFIGSFNETMKYITELQEKLLDFDLSF
jgi:glutaredoxin